MYFVACFAGLQSVAAQNILCNVDEGRREIINETLYTVPHQAFLQTILSHSEGFRIHIFPYIRKQQMFFISCWFFFVLLPFLEQEMHFSIETYESANFCSTSTHSHHHQPSIHIHLSIRDEGTKSLGG